jgi:hypothetical protein
VSFGAFTEDFHHEEKCSLGWMRPFNHFMDPQHGGRALEFGGTLGHPSADWALEDNGHVTTMLVPCMAAGGRQQTFSYRDAQSDLYSALTLPTAAERAASMSLVLQKLGHVMHHIQDMAQPAHTRNEAHSPINPPQRAWIEAYTERYVNGRIADIVAANPYPDPPPIFPRARDYWVTSGASVPMYVGMAEFTAQNFVSYSTGFRYVYNTLHENAEFPLPNAQGKSLSERIVTIRLHDETEMTGRMAVVTGSIFDGQTGATRTDQVLMTASLLDRPLSNNTGHTRLFGVNTYAYESQYPVLFPRAVRFSAGLINHFFAGKLAVNRASSGTGWTITNAGTESMNGAFQLFYQTSSGQRSFVSGGAWTGTLAAGQATGTLPEPPNTAVQLVGVFLGTIGSESMQRVAGKVTNYQPPPVPCGQPISAAGSSAGTTVVHELGTTSGPVQVEFEAYSIPDAIEIRQVNADDSLGTTHFSTGTVSGWHTKTFQHNPGTSGSTKVRMRVTGNSNPDTLWTATVSCPNQSLDNDDRQQDRIGITIGRGGTIGSGCNTGYTDVSLNGKVVARLTFNNAGGGSSTTVTVTAGTHQQYSLVNTITQAGAPGFTCSGDGRPYYTDRGGKKFFPANSGWIAIQ